MTDKIKVKKWINLDENVVYSKCSGCGNELSPYLSIEVEDDVLNALLDRDLILGFSEGISILLLCKNCCNIHLIVEEE